LVGDESVMTSWKRSGPPDSLGRKGGPSLGAERHPLLIVGTDPFEVDQLLTGGELRCPGCAGELRPWGHARERGVRDEVQVVAVRPRRSACSQCRCTHVLVPAFTLVRRADTVAVIGGALLAKARHSVRVGLRRVSKPSTSSEGEARAGGHEDEVVHVLRRGACGGRVGGDQRKLVSLHVEFRQGSET